MPALVGKAKPLLLDLFSGAGGAAVGYARAGFEVVGVDLAPQKNYPFKFIQADALDYVAGHGWRYDAIHASPPCEGFSHLTPKKHRAKHLNLIPHTRYFLQALGVPYVIENVYNARKQLHNPIMLCGTMFHLPIERHRVFEIYPETFELLPPCCHAEKPIPINSSCAQRTANKAECSIGLGGVYWMTRDEMRKAIPPAYTDFIGAQLLRHIEGKLLA